MRADVMRAEDEDTDDTEAADDEEEEVDTRYEKEDVIVSDKEPTIMRALTCLSAVVVRRLSQMCS
jgi:hypothetical protein